MNKKKKKEVKRMIPNMFYLTQGQIDFIERKVKYNDETRKSKSAIIRYLISLAMEKNLLDS